MNVYTAANMSNRVSIIYTYRSPWPRRLAAACAIGVLLVACVAGYRLLQQTEGVGPVAQAGKR
jgi:hypothetical protein